MVTNIVEAGLESIYWCIETCLGVNLKLFRALQQSTPFFVLFKYISFVCVNFLVQCLIHCQCVFKKMSYFSFNNLNEEVDFIERTCRDYIGN